MPVGPIPHTSTPSNRGSGLKATTSVLLVRSAPSIVRQPSDTALFADAAQVNTFQAPASFDHPMLEEFFYVSTNTFEATAHFRHRQFANVVFLDGHVDREAPQPGSLDMRLPDRFVGRLRPDCLRVP